MEQRWYVFPYLFCGAEVGRVALPFLWSRGEVVYIPFAMEQRWYVFLYLSVKLEKNTYKWIILLTYECRTYRTVSVHNQWIQLLCSLSNDL